MKIVDLQEDYRPTLNSNEYVKVLIALEPIHVGHIENNTRRPYEGKVMFTVLMIDGEVKHVKEAPVTDFYKDKADNQHGSIFPREVSGFWKRLIRYISKTNEIYSLDLKPKNVLNIRTLNDKGKKVTFTVENYLVKKGKELVLNLREPTSLKSVNDYNKNMKIGEIRELLHRAVLEHGFFLNDTMITRYVKLRFDGDSLIADIVARDEVLNSVDLTELERSPTKMASVVNDAVTAVSDKIYNPVKAVQHAIETGDWRHVFSDYSDAASREALKSILEKKLRGVNVEIEPFMRENWFGVTFYLPGRNNKIELSYNEDDGITMSRNFVERSVPTMDEAVKMVKQEARKGER